MADKEDYHPFVETPGLRRSSKRQRIVFGLTVGLIAVLTVAIVVALSISLGVINQLYVQATSSSKVCLSQECIKLSAAIISAMDPSVDPCQDFYNFSCGNWVQNNILPNGK